MIRNDDELAVVRQQIELLEACLRSLAQDVRPKSEERYQLMAEVYEDHVREMREQVDTYVRGRGVSTPTAAC